MHTACTHLELVSVFYYDQIRPYNFSHADTMRFMGFIMKSELSMQCNRAHVTAVPSCRNEIHIKYTYSTAKRQVSVVYIVCYSSKSIDRGVFPASIMFKLGRICLNFIRRGFARFSVAIFGICLMAVLGFNRFNVCV